MDKLRLHHTSIKALSLGIVLGIVLYSLTASAAPIYHVELDTSSLNALGTFYVEFQLIDGSPVGGDDDSSATIRKFALTGGMIGAVLEPTFGNVSGSLGGTLTLRDGPALFGPLADLAQAFSVMSNTSLMSFDLELKGTDVDAPTADNFSFLILDAFFLPLPTSGPLGVELVTAAFVSTTPVPVAFSSADPLLTPVISVIPEPATLILTAAGIMIMWGYFALRRTQGQMPWAKFDTVRLDSRRTDRLSLQHKMMSRSFPARSYLDHLLGVLGRYARFGAGQRSVKDPMQ